MQWEELLLGEFDKVNSPILSKPKYTKVKALAKRVDSKADEHTNGNAFNNFCRMCIVSG
jgi:hypothetical protein